MTQKDFLVELISFDKEHWQKIRTNLEVFFKQYVVKTIFFNWDSLHAKTEQSL